MEKWCINCISALLFFAAVPVVTQCLYFFAYWPCQGNEERSGFIIARELEHSGASLEYVKLCSKS